MVYLKQSTARVRVFAMVDSTDHVSPKTGLTPVVNISKAGGALAPAAGAVAEIGNGLYKVSLTTADTNTAGDLGYHATSAGADPAQWGDVVTPGDVDNLDAAVSSRMATFVYTAPANGDLTTLLGRLTSGRATLLDNLDVAVSSRNDVAPDVVSGPALLVRLTAQRGLNLDNLDDTVSSRMAATDYTAPDDTPVLSAVAAVAANVTTLIARLTGTRAALLDNLVNLDAAVSSVGSAGDSAGVTTLLARLTNVRAGLLDNLTLLDAAVSDAISAGDVLNNTVPGGYGAGTAGYALGQIILGVEVPTVGGPINPETLLITIQQGSSYIQSNGQALIWHSLPGASLVGAVITMRLSTLSLNTVYEGEVLAVHSVMVELTSEQTTPLTGRYNYRVSATWPGDVVATLVEGILIVERAP